MIVQWDSSLSVLPVDRVMIAQWESSLSVLPVARVRFPATAEYFKGFFPGWSVNLSRVCLHISLATLHNKEMLGESMSSVKSQPLANLTLQHITYGYRE